MNFQGRRNGYSLCFSFDLGSFEIFKNMKLVGGEMVVIITSIIRAEYILGGSYLLGQ